MRKPTKLLFAFICVLFLQNCTTDDFDSRTVPNLQTEADIIKDEEFRAANFGAPTTGNFIGLIKDTAGNIVSGVQITIGNAVTTTDRNGMFVMNNANVFENFAYIKAQKEGYIDGSRVVIPKTSGENRIDITLLKKEITATINSGEFSEVSLPNGAKVNFSGGFVRQNGTPYNGQVAVVLHYIEPNLTSTFTQMPGSLLGQTEANDARNLETYGMLSVNLFSPSGEQININEFNRATIEFPVHYSQSSTAPDFIPLWYFDEAQGYWKEEGQAVKFGDRYVAEVSHFTWWNCDVPLDTIELCFNLMPSNTSQSTPYFVIIKRLTNNQFIYSGIVYSNEFECGFIPRNEEVSVSIYQVSAGSCFGQIIHTQTIGGYTIDTSTEISFVEPGDLLTTNITGIANNCDGNPITNGYLYVDEYNTFAITNGVINVGLQHCELQTVTVQLFDFDTSQWSITDNVLLNTQNINLGVLSTCDNSGGFFNGNLRLSTQQEVNDFGVFGFTSVVGNVTIGDETNYTDITDLSPLASITNISDDLKIIGNENLLSLQDMNNIAHVGHDLIIENNPSLTSLQGFSFSTINALKITNNDALTTLQGMDNFSSIFGLQINGNDGLTSVAGFNNSVNIETGLTISANNSLTSLQGIATFNLTSLNDLTIGENSALTSLHGIESITALRFLNIQSNDALASLAQLANITTLLSLDINDNDALLNLEGLEQLIQVRYLLVSNNDALLSLQGIENITLDIANYVLINIGVRQWEGDCTGYINGPNPNLTDLCALQNALITSNWNTNNDYCVVIVGNAYNPSGQDILNGNCSQ